MPDLTSLWFNETIVLIIVQLIVYYFKLGLRMIIHPGTFFAAIWLFSVFSQQILMNLDLALVRDFNSILELNIFVAITSLFFTFWALIDRQKGHLKNDFDINLKLPYYKKLVVIMLIGSFVLMLYTWYSIGVTSLNLAQIRDFNTKDKTNYFGVKANFFLSIIKYTQFFYPIISIVSGYFLGRFYLLRKPIKIEKVYLYIPLIVSIIYVATNGGRNPLFVGIKYYFVGICFAMPYYLGSSEKEWIIKKIVILFIGVALFSTFVSDSRNSYQGVSVYSQNFQNPILSALSGGIEYAGAHYFGYQLRNLDTFDEKKLGFGYYTFYSIYDLSLPLSNYHGLKGTLGNFLGFKENTIDYFYLWENDIEGYFTTNSVYLGLKLDFGFYGTILFLFFFTYYTHYLFVKIQKNKDITIFTIFWFSLCFEFWASSNFKSSYASGLIGFLIMTILFSKFFLVKKTNFSI